MNDEDKITESAFPIPFDERPGSYVAQPGMMLIDYFASEAMKGVRHVASITYSDVAKEAYDMAEAMMRERDRRGIPG